VSGRVEGEVALEPGPAVGDPAAPELQLEHTDAMRTLAQRSANHPVCVWSGPTMLGTQGATTNGCSTS